jgi:hypothetical protein
MTNHFLKNTSITTKAGLLLCLESLPWIADIRTEDILPRGYNLAEPAQLQAFIDDFKFQKAVSILKKLLEKWQSSKSSTHVNDDFEISVSKGYYYTLVIIVTILWLSATTHFYFYL